MTAHRERLRNRRRSETSEIEVAGLRYKVSVSYFDDGRLAEAFGSNHKSGNASDVAARDAGILLSFSAVRLPGRDDLPRSLAHYRRISIRRDRRRARHAGRHQPQHKDHAMKQKLTLDEHRLEDRRRPR